MRIFVIGDIHGCFPEMHRLTIPDLEGYLPAQFINTCPQCGKTFKCGKSAGEAHCWCADLPHVLPVPEGKSEGCLCPTCLSAAIEEFLADSQDRRQVAPK
jgi:hypothetical protein